MNRNLKRKLLVTGALYLISIISLTWSEVFSASSSMETLLFGEDSVSDFILQQIDKETEKILQLKHVIYEYRERNNQESKKRAYLNPVDSYLLIKRFLDDWISMQKQITIAFSPDEFIKKIARERQNRNLEYPDSDDLKMAGQGLMKLQDTYNLTATQLSMGNIPKTRTNGQLSLKDCFHVGLSAFVKKDYYHAITWFEETHRRFKLAESLHQLEEDDPKEWTIFDFIAYVTYFVNNPQRSIIYYRKLIQLKPDHPTAYGNMQNFINEMIQKNITVPKFEAEVDEFPLINQRPYQNWLPSRDIYESLCRGDIPLNETVKQKLFCYYKFAPHPFLKLAPLKVEMVFVEPEILILKDAVSRQETEILKFLAKPKLHRATVFSKDSAKATADYRTSKTMWLRNIDNPVLPRIHSRIGLFTDLNMETAEQLQMNNYGLAGHYDPHYDYSRGAHDGKTAFHYLGTRNRIATFMIYLETAELGGATVFPQLKLSVFAEKGDGVFWWNLKKSGLGDVRSLHAGCPVIAGEKWVANSWLHEAGQEFLRPCGLLEKD